MKNFVSIFITSTLLIICFSSYSFSIDSVKKLLEFGSCPKCVLSGADLKRAYLKWADLSGANLSRADLSGANLAEAQLVNANLNNAIIVSANLNEANLSGADLRGADLDGADLSWAQMRESILCNTTMPDGGVAAYNGVLSNGHLSPIVRERVSFAIGQTQ